MKENDFFNYKFYNKDNILLIKIQVLKKS